MRFANGEYSPQMQAGALLGHVFDGEIDKARSRVSRSVRKKAITFKPLPPGRLTRSTILPGLPVEETGHDLVERLFTIYHIFVAV